MIQMTGIRDQESAPIGRLSAELRSACRRGETDAFGETAFRLSRGGTAFHRVSPGQTLLSEDTSCGSHQARPFSRPRSAFGETSFRLSQRWNCVPPDPARSHNSLLHHVPSTTPRGIHQGLAEGKFCFSPRLALLHWVPACALHGVCRRKHQWWR